MRCLLQLDSAAAAHSGATRTRNCRRRASRSFQEPIARNPRRHHRRGSRHSHQPNDFARLPDLKGHRGFGFDESAWIGTAFDVGLMFIGPFTVYLGGLMGPRRILLTAAAMFTLLFIFLPFIHSYGLLIVATCLAGLASGTFYPLTLTFALRNIPLQVPSFHDCSVRLVRGWRGKHRPITLRLVQRSSVLAMDVLEFGGDHAGDDVMHLLRDTEVPSRKRARRGAKLRGIFVRERRFCIDFGCVRTG